MISETVWAWQRPVAWQQAVAAAVRDPALLLERLQLPKHLLPAALAAAQDFPLRVPEAFIARMVPGDIHDPLLRQVLPLGDELLLSQEYTTDPVGDQDAMVVPGLVHKYHGRVLLIMTGACAVHCRYCFRRHFPYGQANPLASHWHDALATIAGDTSIHEVILSGGDPLSLSDERLHQCIQDLTAIPHLTRLRIHTRLPVVIPQRITPALVALLSHSRLRPVVVLHINHPNELDTHLTDALTGFMQHHITLLNQAVLLRGVNDRVDTLVLLSERLFSAGIMPYYLHQLDKVQGAAHFLVTPSRARELYRQLTAQLPGYLLPRLVQEIPGMAAKLPM
ncbi:MAG: EF-P beta-lysylation protein EpmB [Gammaproteobacteria bacterium]|nr:EF-P beta-lysylation protein EpmB [Gammaproteobacteria bacterium]